MAGSATVSVRGRFGLSRPRGIAHSEETNDALQKEVGERMQAENGLCESNELLQQLADNNLIRHTAIVTDITQPKFLEAQLSQTQTLETVGRLAGGIAYEFNSILAAIIGQSEWILGHLPPA